MTLEDFIGEAAGHSKGPASTVIADTLRIAILKGLIAGGAPIRQDRIAASFGVSHIPVREALRQLAAEGLVKAYPNRGVVAAQMSADDVRELTELRTLLEGQAARWAAPAILESELLDARGILDALDAATEVDDMLRLNAAFHAALYKPCGRPHSLALIDGLRVKFERYLRLTWTRTGHRAPSQQEHRAILGCFAERDAAGAAKLIERHIAHTGRTILDVLHETT